jgi:malonate transporter
MSIIMAIAPIFVLIILGYSLRRGGIPSREFWNLNDQLVYYVLMPALFFVRISTADLGEAMLGPYAGVLYAGFLGAVIYGVVCGLVLRRGRALASTVMQGSARFNTFVALAVAEALYGTPGLQLAVLGAAVLVPGVNLIVVILFALVVPRKGGSIIGGTLWRLVTNPLIIAIVLALLVNRAGLGPIPVLHPTGVILGAAALPIMLLCVGANLKLAGLRADVLPMIFASFGKLALFPVIIIIAAMTLGASPLQAQVALIYGALPTGVAAYTLARQFGGDAPLMASMITVQTGLSFLTMPLWLHLGERLFLN